MQLLRNVWHGRSCVGKGVLCKISSPYQNILAILLQLAILQSVFVGWRGWLFEDLTSATLFCDSDKFIFKFLHCFFSDHQLNLWNLKFCLLGSVWIVCAPSLLYLPLLGLYLMLGWYSMGKLLNSGHSIFYSGWWFELRNDIFWCLSSWLTVQMGWKYCLKFGYT